MTMSDEERARILRMVSEGKISPEEAADILEALGPQPQAGGENRSWSASNAQGEVRYIAGQGSVRRRPRTLVIHVKEKGESKVNIRIPFGLTKAAGKFIPRQAQSYLGKYEINLQEFLDGLAEADSGTLLEVKDGDSKVLIAVE
jgi:hypothetical protein